MRDWAYQALMAGLAPITPSKADLVEKSLPNPLGGLDPRHVLMLLTVSRIGSINRAAKLLGISQPALSNIVKMLEAKVGGQLLNRTRSGVYPTDLGELLVGHAASLEAELRRTNMAIEAAGNNAVETLSIGTTLIGKSRIVPTAINLFLQENPNNRVRVSDESETELRAMLLTGDLELVVGPMTPEANQPEIQETLIFQADSVIVASANNPLLTLATLKPKDLTEAEWILPITGNPVRVRFDQEFRRIGIEPPPAAIECGSYTMIRALMRERRRLAILAREVCLSEIESGEFCVIDVGLDPPRRPMGILTRLGAKRSSKIDRFHACLVRAGEQLNLIDHRRRSN
jgi:LysR family transcriptional regulator of gallate degradation